MVEPSLEVPVRRVTLIAVGVAVLAVAAYWLLLSLDRHS